MTYLKVFSDFRELMEPLNAEEKGRLFEAMLAYSMDGAEPTLEGNERFLWPVARRTIDQEAAAYESKVEVNRENGRKGATARWSKGKDSDRHAGYGEGIAKHSENSQEQEQEQEQDQEQEEEKDQEQAQEYVYEQAPAAGAHTPRREDIEAYCRERKNGIDAAYFYDYYAAKGWRIGRDPITDWQALVRAWERRDSQKPSGPGTASMVQGIVNMAQARRRERQRNSLLNYQEQASTGDAQLVDLDLNEL